jgi:hypothetical protein
MYLIQVLGTALGITSSIMICSSSMKASAEPSPFIVSAPKVHSELIESASREYSIHLGGTVDMDNSTTRGYESYDVAFQPNISLEIENLGSTPVVDPWVVINDVRDWRTIDSIIAEATRNAIDEQDRLMLLYEFIRSNRYHTRLLFTGEELHDPVKYFNSYGAGLCDDSGQITCALAYRAGFNKERHGGDPLLRSLHGHVMSEVAVDGNYQFLDTDENAFYLDPENERVMSGDEIVRDSDLVARDYSYGPLFSTWTKDDKAPALFGRDDTQRRAIVIGHEMHLVLRPGEKLSLRWDNIGKIPGPQPMLYYANSFLDYLPELNETCIENADKSHGITASEGALVGSASDAFITFKINSPYVICGAAIKAEFDCGKSTDNVAVAVSADGEHWSDMTQRSGKTSFVIEASLDDTLEVKKKIARYSYFVRISLGSKNGSARLLALQLHTDLLASPIALPRLTLGQNRIRYSDKTTGPRKIKVTHTYQESGNIKSPPSPKLIYPAKKEITDDAWIKFKWSEIPGGDKYHLRVSRRPDLATSYRPCFDVVVDDTTFGNPRSGLFSPDHTYYWSVRAQNKDGVWGNWSPTETFSWNGPGPPVKLKTITKNGNTYLSWKPNPRGNRPLSYEIYASDINGFAPEKAPYKVLTLGEVPSNFVTETSRTELLVVSSNPTDKAPDKSFYRVIAIDKNGVPGGSSWQLELKHPFIYSSPVLEAKAGKPYQYQVLTLRSLGNLQRRYQKPNYAFWEKEGYEFFLTNAPPWLKIDKQTGLISGVPNTTDAGKTPVTTTVRRTWPHEVKKGDDRYEYFSKDSHQFQATDQQSFTLTVIVETF